MSDKEYTSQYRVPADPEILKRLEEYRRNSEALERLISDAIGLFSHRTEEALVNYIGSVLMQSFIPSYLAVFLDSPNVREPIRTIAYRNMQPWTPPVTIQSLEEYRAFFKLRQQSATYREIAEHLSNRGRDIALLNPELVVPMQGLNGLHGIVVIGSKVLDDDYSEAERMFIDRFFVFASIGLQNVMHYNRAVTDYKTDLFNHSFFDQRLHEEIAKAKRYGSQFSLFVADLDHFKALNDRYGHMAGDEVLVQFARVFERQLREEDVVARYGGEEFLALLVECSEEAAVQVAERVRRSIASTTFTFQDTEISVTVSIGITQYHGCYGPAGLDEPDAIIERADHALYCAKAQGRNRVCVARPGLLAAIDRRKRDPRRLRSERGCEN